MFKKSPLTIKLFNHDNYLQAYVRNGILFAKPIINNGLVRNFVIIKIPKHDSLFENKIFKNEQMRHYGLT